MLEDRLDDSRVVSLFDSVTVLIVIRDSLSRFVPVRVDLTEDVSVSSMVKDVD